MTSKVKVLVRGYFYSMRLKELELRGDFRLLTWIKKLRF